MKQIFINSTCSHVVTDVFHNSKKTFSDCHISVKQQELSAECNSQSFVPICKSMEFAGAKEQMGNFVLKRGIVIIVLNVL